MSVSLKKMLNFEFGDTPEQVEARRQLFLIRFFAIVGSFFLIPLGTLSVIEGRVQLGGLLIAAAFVFSAILYFTKQLKYLAFLRCTYSFLISLLTLYLTLGGGAGGTGVYYAFGLCFLIISYSGHRYGLGVAIIIVLLLSLGLYSGMPWVYPYQEIHKSRIIIGISLVFMLMLIFEWMRMHSYLALRRQSEDYMRDSLTDPLTGAFNRAGLELKMTEWQAERFPSALAMVDLDHFKSVNDTYGYNAGDLALITIVKVIRQHIKGKDLFARWSGEEFILVFANSSQSNVEKVLNDIRVALKATPIEFGEHSFNLTLSAGVSPIEHADDLDHAQHIADQKLYVAKTTGRDKIVG